MASRIATGGSDSRRKQRTQIQIGDTVGLTLVSRKMGSNTQNSLSSERGMYMEVGGDGKLACTP